MINSNTFVLISATRTMNNEIDNSRSIVHSQRGLQFEQIHQQSRSVRIIARTFQEVVLDSFNS